MDAMTVTNGFATLVGLLSVFKQERKDAKAATAQEFMGWLEAHRHQEIKDVIAQSHHLTAELDKLLHEDTQEILAKLSAMDSVLATIASRVESFQGIVHILNPSAVLSEQALHFLQALVNSQSEEIAVFRHMGGAQLQLVPTGGPINVTERRLVEDDLDTLAGLGLLTHRIGSTGTDFYRITRDAIRLVKLIEQRSA